MITGQKLFRFSSFSKKRVSSYNNWCAYICILIENTTHQICIYRFFSAQNVFPFFITITVNTENIANAFFQKTTNEIFVFPQSLNNELSHRVPTFTDKQSKAYKNFFTKLKIVLWVFFSFHSYMFIAKFRLNSKFYKYMYFSLYIILFCAKTTSFTFSPNCI